MADAGDTEYDPEDSTGFDGIPRADDDEHGKYKLCVEGIEKIVKYYAPKMKNCFIWVDYSSINQDKAKIRSQKIDGTDMAHIQQHINALTVADCLFTPIYGLNTNSLSVISANPYNDYQADDWNCNNLYSYLNRGWCRFDMFCAANLKMYDSEIAAKVAQ
ncbi:MAG: hypothetical protein F2825_09660, partial [Actinobacteria bacterium]|nr:hypothetical protein [Actinomycetota bacterium]